MCSNKDSILGHLHVWVTITVECERSVGIDVKRVFAGVLALATQGITKAIASCTNVGEPDYRISFGVLLSRATDVLLANHTDKCIDCGIAIEIHGDLDDSTHPSSVGARDCGKGRESLVIFMFG